MFERPQSGERAVLVHVNFSSRIDQEDLSEFRELAKSAGANPVAIVTSARVKPDARLLIGESKANEILQVAQTNEADLILVDFELSPAQQRNLERILNLRVLDRTGLILDIFAQRASSHEGRLQVELAQLQHMSTRLVRGWTHLERQKGGIGLRGPGETQLETDRRLIAGRIKQLHKRLDKVRNSRGQGRRSRQKAEIPTVSIVGYTNAGKSTLFNRLTESKVYAADQLFATLDPTLRRIDVADCGPVILADTVGFIRQLPHDLVEAFQSTLQETREADLLLHVVDVSVENYQDNMQQVNLVLKEIGADKVPQLIICNKIDAIDGCVSRTDCDVDDRPKRVWLSAISGDGIDELMDALGSLLHRDVAHVMINIPVAFGKLRAELFRYGTVLAERTIESGSMELEVIIKRKDLAYLHSKGDFISSEITADPGQQEFAVAGQG